MVIKYRNKECKSNCLFVPFPIDIADVLEMGLMDDEYKWFHLMCVIYQYNVTSSSNFYDSTTNNVHCIKGKGISLLLFAVRPEFHRFYHLSRHKDKTTKSDKLCIAW